MKITKTFDIQKDGDWLVANTPELDRDHDRIFPQKINVDNFRKNPAFFWGHNYKDPWAVIGKVAEWEQSDTALRFRPELREPAGENDPMHIIRSLWDNDLVRASSIGFRPMDKPVKNEDGGYDYGEIELLEISLVPIPAHQDALRMAMKAFDKKDDSTVIATDEGVILDSDGTVSVTFAQEADADIETEPNIDEPSHDASEVDMEQIAAALLPIIETIGERLS